MSNAKAKQKLQGATFENEMQVVEAAQISQRAKFDIACFGYEFFDDRNHHHETFVKWGEAKPIDVKIHHIKRTENNH